MGAEKETDGLIVVRSSRSVDETIARLKEALVAHKLRIFAELDFSADAAAEGMQLRPTRMLIAGNPKAGTPLMEAAPTIAIDLPLKALVWSDSAGHTSVAYNDPTYIARRHALPQELVGNIAGFGKLVESVVSDSH